MDHLVLAVLSGIASHVYCLLKTTPVLPNSPYIYLDSYIVQNKVRIQFELMIATAGPPQDKMINIEMPKMPIFKCQKTALWMPKQKN